MCMYLQVSILMEISNGYLKGLREKSNGYLKILREVLLKLLIPAWFQGIFDLTVRSAFTVQSEDRSFIRLSANILGCVSNKLWIKKGNQLYSWKAGLCFCTGPFFFMIGCLVQGFMHIHCAYRAVQKSNLTKTLWIKRVKTHLYSISQSEENYSKLPPQKWWGFKLEQCTELSIISN